jgi:alpha/beta superfamily hydrolase
MRRSLALLLLCAPLAAQTALFRDLVFANATRTNNVAYGSALNRWTSQVETLRLDRYEPAGDVGPAARPAMVVIHGGGFVGGDKGDPQMVALATDFARRGYFAVSINYRMAPPGSPITPQVITDAMEDAKAAVRFLRANAAAWRIDVNRIATLGSSAGAYTGLAVAHLPGEGNSGNPGFPSNVHATVDLWGALQDPNQMEPGEPPLCIIHGTAHVLHPLVGAGHAPWNLIATFRPEYLAFLYEHLKAGQLSGLGARAGWSSPGSITLDHFGIAGDPVFLFLSTSRVDLDLGPLGVLCLNPALLVPLGGAVLPATPRLPTAAQVFPVPGGLAGVTLYWQALHLTSGGAARLLTNCVATTF